MYHMRLRHPFSNRGSPAVLGINAALPAQMLRTSSPARRQFISSFTVFHSSVRTGDATAVSLIHSWAQRRKGIVTERQSGPDLQESGESSCGLHRRDGSVIGSSSRLVASWRVGLPPRVDRVSCSVAYYEYESQTRSAAASHLLYLVGLARKVTHERFAHVRSRKYLVGSTMSHKWHNPVGTFAITGFPKLRRHVDSSTRPSFSGKPLSCPAHTVFIRITGFFLCRLCFFFPTSSHMLAQ